MHTVTLARHAMATRFELVLHGENPAALRATGEEALDEIDRLEDRLSLFRPASEIAHVNALAARQPVKVTPEVFSLLGLAQRLHAESKSAFDITIAPLVRCWGFMGGGGQTPAAAALEEARAKVGMNLVHLDAQDFTVQFAREGVMLDLGAIGKGYAVERAAILLRESGVSSALLHGGTSTACAIGHPPEAEAWTIAIAGAQDSGSQGSMQGPASGNSSPPLAAVALKDEALSVSAIWGKCFKDGGRTLGHILDPRTGHPANGALLSVVVLPSATETDALSTALLIRGAEGHNEIASLRPQMRTLLLVESEQGLRVEGRGIP